MTVIQERPARDADRIQQVCAPCSKFLAGSLNCGLLVGGGLGYLDVFDAKRCNPRDYLVSFLRARISRTNEPNPHDRAEDVAHAVVHRLFERQSAPPSLLSPDLIGLRRFLAARAEQTLIDERRKVEGRVRCGNCRHHRHVKGTRTCNHPDPDHFWSGRAVLASEDPRKFDPPCDRYQARPADVSLDGDADRPGPVVATEAPSPDAGIEASQAQGLLQDSFAAVQRRDPEGWRIVQMFFFEKKTLEEIAGALSVSSKTVMRRKTSALDVLRDELAGHGIESLGELI